MPLPDPQGVFSLAGPAVSPVLSGLSEAVTSVGLQLWADRGFLLIGAGVVLLVASGLALWDRRGADS